MALNIIIELTRSEITQLQLMFKRSKALHHQEMKDTPERIRLMCKELGIDEDIESIDSKLTTAYKASSLRS